MSDWTIYYNPKCGTCRKVKERLEAKGITPKLIEYLKTPPTVADLESILQKMNKNPEAITRFQEDPWQEANVDPATFPRDQWLKLMVENPILIQRPIVIHGNKAVVARPPEHVDALFS